jgi:DNA invertase Pin-like site-specific DNA recombinase
MKRKAIAYIRTIGNNASRFGQTHEQEFAIRTYCHANGIELVEVFFDETFLSPFERKGFCKAIDFLIQHDDIHYLLLYKYINLTADTNEFVRSMIALDDLDTEIQVTHLKAFDLRKDTPQSSKWIELN